MPTLSSGANSPHSLSNLVQIFEYIVDHFHHASTHGLLNVLFYVQQKFPLWIFSVEVE